MPKLLLLIPGMLQSMLYMYTFTPVVAETETYYAVLLLLCLLSTATQAHAHTHTAPRRRHAGLLSTGVRQVGDRLLLHPATCPRITNMSVDDGLVATPSIKCLFRLTAPLFV